MDKLKTCFVSLVSIMAVFTVLLSSRYMENVKFAIMSSSSDETTANIKDKKEANGEQETTLRPSLHTDDMVGDHSHISLKGTAWSTIMPTTLEPDTTVAEQPFTLAASDNALKTTDSTNSKPYTLSPEVRHAMRNRFLFPIMHYGGGPNFQYRMLKTALKFAVFTNRTIVLSDFRNHRTKYDVGGVFFNDTFNVGVLRSFMPVASIEEFTRECGPHMDSVWTVLNPVGKVIKSVRKKYEDRRRWMYNRTNVNIPESDTVTIPESRSEGWRALEDTADDSCTAMLFPLSFESARFPKVDQISRAIDGHLVRPSLLQEAVEGILPRLCDGNPILGFHWRNKTGEQCRIGNLGKNNDTRCHVLLEMQDKILSSLVSKIKMIMEREKIGCVFMATAPKEPRENVIRQLITGNVSRVLTIDDVIGLHNPAISSFGKDGYFISLTEQEICARSKVFVGIGKSNWSEFVFKERSAFHRRRNYDVMADFPDIIDIASQYV